MPQSLPFKSMGMAISLGFCKENKNSAKSPRFPCFWKLSVVLAQLYSFKEKDLEPDDVRLDRVQCTFLCYISFTLPFEIFHTT